MDRSSVVYLVSSNPTQDELGVFHDNPTERKVYCDVRSISQREWYEGGRNGLNPEFQVVMFKYDYQGEDVLKYNDEYYTIYRTYVDRNENIELYCERRKGTDNG